MAYIGSTPTNQYYKSLTERFNGDSSDVTFTLSRPVYSVYDIEVIVNNVQQDPFSAYTVDGTTTLTFTEAPSTGTGNILVSYKNYNLTTFVPGEGTVSTSTISDGSVTNAKLAGSITGDKIAVSNLTGNLLASSTITGDKIASGTIGSSNLTTTGVSAGDYGGVTNIPVINVDTSGRVTYASNVAISSELPFSNTVALAQAQAISLSF